MITNNCYSCHHSLCQFQGIVKFKIKTSNQKYLLSKNKNKKYKYKYKYKYKQKQKINKNNKNNNKNLVIK